MRILILLIAAALGAGNLVAQTQLATDNFSSGTAGNPLGSNWTGCGEASGAFSKLTYETTAAGGAGFFSQDCALYTGVSFPSNQYAQATIAAATPSSTTEAAVLLRANATPSTNESYIACGWNAHDFSGSDGHYRIWSFATNGALASLYLSTTQSPASGDTVSCQVVGVTVNMKVNGTVVASVTDTSNLTSGSPGLYYIDPSGGGPSTSDVIWSNFSAGAGAALISLTITPSSATATEGTFQQFSGTATYSDGTTASMNSWASSNTSVVAIDAYGLAYGASPGVVTITGSTGLDSGTATFTVQSTQLYTPLVDDDFIGTQNAYLGSNWTGCGYNGGNYSKLVYANTHEAGGGGFSSQACAVYTGYQSGTFPADQYATAKVVAPTPTASNQALLVVRGKATPNVQESYIGCGWNAQDFQPKPAGEGQPKDWHYRIWSLGPNTDPTLGGPQSLYLSNVLPQTGDQLACQAVGSTITMRVNGTVIGSVTDTSGLTGGLPGLYYIDPNSGAPPTGGDPVFSNFVAGAGPALASLAIAPSSATVTKGSYQAFAGTATYADGTTTTATLTWTSSNTAAATVSTSGLALGVNAGTSTITGTFSGSSGTAALTVQNGTVKTSTKSTFYSVDPFLNLGTATNADYTAPGSSAPSPTVPLRSNSSVPLWLIFPNPWGIPTKDSNNNVPAGTINEQYSGAGQISINLNLSNLPGGGVDGSPLVQVGCDQYGGCQATGQLQFPKKLSGMSSLIVDYTYTLAGTFGGASHNTDMIWDEWVCPGDGRGGPPAANQLTPVIGIQGCLEVEVLPYYSFFGGATTPGDTDGATFVRTVNLPVTLDGVSTTLALDEYNGSTADNLGSNQQQDILYVPHTLPGYSAASIRFDMLVLLKQAVSDFMNPTLNTSLAAFGAVDFEWLMGMEPGTEFGGGGTANSATQSYSLTFSHLEFEQTLLGASQPIMLLVF